MIFGVEINLVFTMVYLVLGIPLILLELYGIRRKDNGDTISENWYWLRNRVPVLVVPMVFFLGWLLYHFTFEGWV
jgi:hypothetical protein